MTVIATARTRPPGTVEGGVTFVDTPTLLADSDVITVHAPLPRKLAPNSATFTRTGQPSIPTIDEVQLPQLLWCCESYAGPTGARHDSG
jgi:hypothetical protein